MGNMFHTTQYDQQSAQHETEAKTPSATAAIVAVVAAAATQSLVTPVATSVVAPPLGLQKSDKDATDYNLDYEEGLGRGFIKVETSLVSWMQQFNWGKKVRASCYERS